MKVTFKRLFSFLLALALIAGVLPAAYAQGQQPQAEVLTDADYAAADDVFAQIYGAEARQYKNATQTEKADAAEKIVLASDNYVEGSLERNGNAFTWWTDEGIRCTYNPRMLEKHANMKAPENAEASGIYNEPMATKGGSPSSNQVYLIGPYYGIDDNFSDQYKNEATDAAAALGDTDGYTLYSGTAATIDKVAEAISNGAVVFVDSHGTTDYDGDFVCYDPNADWAAVYDYVSGAKYSYICLTTKTGITNADYSAGAMYFVDSDGIPCMCVNGATIANHMKKNSPSGLLWIACCLGMATNTICEPMRNKGVEVVYGYSQSVTFLGDYIYEELFWDAIYDGATVAEAIAEMKEAAGDWDYCDEMLEYYLGFAYSLGYDTLSNARKYRCAFPIVVSDEDAHPGKRTSSSYGADSRQTVKSTYTLKMGSLAGMTMSLGNSLAANFVVAKDDLTGTDNYAVIEKAYADGTTKSVTIPQSQWQAYGESGYYFTYAGVTAKEMTDVITVNVYNAAGEQVIATYTRTIEDYCYQQILKEEAKAAPDAEKLALYVDILKYGAAAQDFFSDYNIQNLATARLSAAQLAYGTKNASMTDIRVMGDGYAGATLSLKNEISMNFVYVNETIDQASYATITFTDHYGNAKSKTVQAADFQVYGTTGKYIVVNGMSVADCTAKITVKLYKANGTVLSTTVDSVESYIARMSNADAIYPAIMKLATSAYNYFH